jgi:hypothetical protein
LEIALFGGTLEIETDPVSGVIIPSKTSASVVFPAPLVPTNAINSPELILIVIPSKALFVLLSYLNEISLMSTFAENPVCDDSFQTLVVNSIFSVVQKSELVTQECLSLSMNQGKESS